MRCEINGDTSQMSPLKITFKDIKICQIKKRKIISLEIYIICGEDEYLNLICLWSF